MILESVFALALLQVPAVVNPTRLVLTCPDHDKDTEHEIDVIDGNGAVVSTILGGDPAADANGDVTFTLNLQPVKFGQYRFVVRAVAVMDGQAAKSANSPQSDIWVRGPGAPSKPGIR